ncbi:zinc transport system ATP-binding protein [Geothermobacter ehrlichii]|uniref:Zinc transport system ATP-binding protein n=1 Tax=Geothermobacter ehrlichii TaxID=213224 RepID=A0A5D3WKJ1_9BACT|nr:metal ABC transporter ATP-binding protein [Geothermobacter ehrlichii]TYO99180.1 zinc transport system ATP-binding protein [Geothermobacter ehrlichii]
MTEATDRLLLGLEDVSYQAKDRLLIDRVSLQVRRGEILTIIGPNGAGKTTLLKLALGLLPPSAGRVRRAPGLRVGYMPQRLAIDPSFPLTARRFLSLAGPTAPGSRRKILAEVGLQQQIDHQISHLSGGELQRLLLARALLRDPELLVLDEPAQGIDVHGQAELYRLLADIRRQRGCGILLVSHDLHLVMAATDQVLCLNRHICCSGSPESVARTGEFLELFGPAASRSLAIYSHETDHHRDHRHG